MSTDKTDSGWRKRQIALDIKAENARELGLDYAPDKTIMEMAQTISHGWWLDDNKLEAFADLVRADERNKTWTPEHWTEYERSIAETEREACHALRQTLSNPHEHCQISAHAYDMAIAAYGAAIRARGNT